MPIRPEQKARYPANWNAISLNVRAEAQNKCEWCGAENRRPNPRTGSIVVLTVAHLDHNPANCARENLRALCQRCHLLYDAEHHSQTRRKVHEAIMLSQHGSTFFGDLPTAEQAAMAQNPAPRRIAVKPKSRPLQTDRLML